MVFKHFEAADAGHLDAVATLWNAACGPTLAITPHAVRFNTLPTTGASQAGQLALVAGRAVGFVLASTFPAGALDGSSRGTGWIDALAVSPDSQRCGIGAALLAWAEGWLAEQDCLHFWLGGGLRPFVPGLPAALGVAGFFHKRGYASQPEGGHVWDVARSLADYTSPASVRQGLPDAVRPARPGEEDALLAFLQREFLGRWRLECAEHLRSGGRLSDYLVLLTDHGIDGFCVLTFEDSLRPLDRFFMADLPRPWGQLGPIGVGRECRGAGYGARLLDAGLRRLRGAGVDGCVIDWTDLLDFYGKFGFRPYRQYAMLVKEAVAPRRVHAAEASHRGSCI